MIHENFGKGDVEKIVLNLIRHCRLAIQSVTTFPSVNTCIIKVNKKDGRID